MRIGIIGAGKTGSALVRHWAGIGHEVAVANSRGPERLGRGLSRSGRSGSARGSGTSACRGFAQPAFALGLSIEHRMQACLRTHFVPKARAPVPTESLRCLVFAPSPGRPLVLSNRL
ncbi:NAD(P)-binding domain-containing protein [Streptomyces coelicoflavus]|uniref:NAD(P)-binding domain-containing protein n=1 Tax=Streptomyces coelicoflavus TaxID=285562 RepID=UPI0036AF37AD